MNITTPTGGNFATSPRYDPYQSYFYPRINSSFPLASTPFSALSPHDIYAYPNLRYTPYSYPSLIALNAYPNTLSTNLKLPQDLSLNIDVSKLPIIPPDLLEQPKQPDNRLHDLNPYNAFSYHTPDDESQSYPERPFIPPTRNMFRHFYSPLFTSSSNFQYILPNGRIGELHFDVPPFKEFNYTPEEMNKQIYDARKAKGEEVVLDSIGRPYTPGKQYNLNDSQDYLDENIAGQITDYYQYNLLDPRVNTPQNQAFINGLTQNFLTNPTINPLGDLFISDILDSNTGLVSPLARANYNNPNGLNPSSILNPLTPLQQTGSNNMNFNQNSMMSMPSMASMMGGGMDSMMSMPSMGSMMGGGMDSMMSMPSMASMMGGMDSMMSMPSMASMMGGMGNPSSMMGMPSMGMPSMGMPSMGMPSMGMPSMGGMGSTSNPMSAVQSMTSFVNSKMGSITRGKDSITNLLNDLGGTNYKAPPSMGLNDVFNGNTTQNPNQIDYTGTNSGEYYHIMQYMQESLATITQQPVSYMDFNGNLVSPEYASKETTGNVPFFDVVSESYGWMDNSPYYQDYVNNHIIKDHGGIHDVITPRGFDPASFLMGGFPELNWGNNDVYKTPYAKPVTVTDPRLNLF